MGIKKGCEESSTSAVVGLCKNKGVVIFPALSEGVTLQEEQLGSMGVCEEVPETFSKKKVKKYGQEEHDFNKNLAELDEKNPSGGPNLQPSLKNVDNQLGQEEGKVESASPNKNKKRKEKEKQKKAAAASLAVDGMREEVKTGNKNEVSVHKKVVPKHVRQKLEILARRKEAEELKKKEEEDKRREDEKKEEEERLRKVEEERLKKEKNDAKLLKEKEEGKPLTKNQKKKLNLLAERGKALLANAGGLQLSTEQHSKKPLYLKKKSKLHDKSNGIDVPESSDSKDCSDVSDEIDNSLIRYVDDGDEWDSAAVDDLKLNLSDKSAFPDELNLELKSSTREFHGERDDFIVNNKDMKADLVNEETTSGQNLRSPICCIMGHVDTGKTKLLDCIRGTNVQKGEAGGITQQIGATYFPAENIRARTRKDAELNVPGLLVIDTPGHASFANLRSRGSGLCDIAVLVVDIMHGLEPQTIESINLLKLRNTMFIVALNKVDKLYGWKTCGNKPFVKAIKEQSEAVLLDFNSRVVQVITQFKEQGLNTELYYKNKEKGQTFSIVPTSAISGEGIPDLLLLLVLWTQTTMAERLKFSDEVQCTILEVKVVEGHGTTVDVVLVNGVLREGDRIVVCGLQGPIVTSIRSLLTPQPMKELRIKGSYLHLKEIKAAQGIKITAQGLEHAIAGTSLYVVRPADNLEEIKESVMKDMKLVMSQINTSGVGVYVQASTLGSLEALLEFLKSPDVSIPVSGISIGPVHKKDVKKASIMLEKNKEYATILAFDVKVTTEACELAAELSVRIFTADIIYHLFDQFKAYIDTMKEAKKKESAVDAVFPCILKILPRCVFNKKDPIVVGVRVLRGTAKIGTPICVPQKDFISIGRIASIKKNEKPLDYAKKDDEVSIKIVSCNSEEQKMIGKHFGIEDELVSKITRSSLDAIKQTYAADLSKEEKLLLFQLKALFKIP